MHRVPASAPAVPEMHRDLQAGQDGAGEKLEERQ